MNIPTDLRYTSDHEWIRLEGDIATVGVTDYAQGELGDIVFVELPAVGTTVEAGAAVGVVESVKAASDIFSPVSGDITEVNDDLDSEPSLANSEPTGRGWFFKLKLSVPAEIESLMNEISYKEFIAD